MALELSDGYTTEDLEVLAHKVDNEDWDYVLASPDLFPHAMRVDVAVARHYLSEVEKKMRRYFDAHDVEMP